MVATVIPYQAHEVERWAAHLGLDHSADCVAVLKKDQIGVVALVVLDEDSPEDSFVLLDEVELEVFLGSQKLFL